MTLGRKSHGIMGLIMTPNVDETQHNAQNNDSVQNHTHQYNVKLISTSFIIIVSVITLYGIMRSVVVVNVVAPGNDITTNFYIMQQFPILIFSIFSMNCFFFHRIPRLLVEIHLADSHFGRQAFVLTALDHDIWSTDILASRHLNDRHNSYLVIWLSRFKT
jgi:hypothetical protein